MIAFWLARVGVGSIDPRSTASGSKDHGAEGVSTYIMAAIATTVVGPLVAAWSLRVTI